MVVGNGFKLPSRGSHTKLQKNTYGKLTLRMHGMHQLPFCFLHIGREKCKQKQWHQTKKDCRTSFSSPTRYLPEKKAIQIFHLRSPRRNQKHSCKKYKQNDKQNLIHRARLSIPPHTAYPAVSNTRIRIRGKRLPCNQPPFVSRPKDICPVSCHTGKIDQQ